MNSKICILRASPALRQQPLSLPLLLLNPPPQKPLESGPIAFSTIDAVATSIYNTKVDIIMIPVERETPPQPETFIYAALYIKLKTTLEVMFISGWGEFMQQYQFNNLDNRISKLEKGPTISKSAKETAVESDR